MPQLYFYPAKSQEAILLPTSNTLSHYIIEIGSANKVYNDISTWKFPLPRRNKQGYLTETSATLLRWGTLSKFH